MAVGSWQLAVSSVQSAVGSVQLAVGKGQSSVSSWQRAFDKGLKAMAKDEGYITHHTQLLWSYVLTEGGADRRQLTKDCQLPTADC